jgi:outer membrane protein assembly factor BamB
MQKNKNKTMAIIFAILMVTSTAGALTMFPTASAHDPAWTFPSYSYIVPAPDPIGVGQKGAIVMWVDYPLPGALVTNDIRRTNYTLTITKPDGTTEKQHWDRNTPAADTTGIEYFSYTPDQVGTYVLKFDYGGQTYTWPGTYNGDIYLPSSRTINWVVQQEQLPAPLTTYPLPTEYWTHPIEGQNTDWWIISSNWLGSPQIVNRFQPYGAAPNSAHVMWSKPIQQGGVVGGMMGPSEDQPVKTYYMGGSYNVRFSNALIMNGKLYYELPWGNSGGGGGYVCNDLRTGKELWRINTTQVGVGAIATNLVPSFGWLESFDEGNQHGALPNGLLVATSGTNWYGYDADTGVLTRMNITNVPTGTSVQGPKGSILRLSLVNYGTSSAPNWYVQEWNSTKLISTVGGIGQSGWYTSTINASNPTANKPLYDYNKSVTLMNGASWSINSNSRYNGVLLLTQGSFGGRADTYYGGNWYGANITAISTKPDNWGQILWAKFFPAPPGNVTRDLVGIDQENGVFIFEDRELLTHTGYSLLTGEKLWGPTEPADQYDYFRSTTRVAYGNFYFGGYGGIVYCYDTLTGNLKWTYGNGGVGNSTDSGLVTAWGHYPIFFPAIADGKVFLATTEHSPDSPYYKGAQVIAINATTGAEIWTLEGWGTGMDANYDIVADGYYAYFNGYDSKVYVIGKGPSETSMNIQSNVIALNNNVLIEGTVNDIAAGTNQDEQAARFPQGVPAVSDASQKAWMQYVYFQKPRPTDVTGVDVTLKVIDPNGNTYHIGTATTDSYGHYNLMYKPEVPGTYTVIASFAGTESYYPSYTEAAFGVSDAAPTPIPTAVPLQSVADLYFVPAIAGLFVFVAIIGVVIILVLRKRP